MTTSRAPLILAIVLLLLPVLYVGSYLALVLPQGRLVPESPTLDVNSHYRFGRELGISRAFWPLEQIDRRMRSTHWAGQPGGPPLIRRLNRQPGPSFSAR